MSNTTSFKLLPRQIDPRKFAQQGIELSGSLPLAELLRLQELLVCEGDEEVVVNLVFGIDEQRQRNLTGHASVNTKMVCQRCLEPVSVTLDCQFALAIIWSEDNVNGLPKSWDPWIVGEGPTDIYQVIEDELLLILPMVAYHSEPCVPQTLFSSGDAANSGQQARSDSGNANPFQVLEQLKKDR